MGWRFDNPLYTLATDQHVESAKKLWEGESLGGLTEDNNRLPVPVVGLLALTILTAFLVTFPLWGQRPKAHIYTEMVQAMNDQQVVAAQDDAKKMEIIMDKVKNSEHIVQLQKHPVEYDDLQNLAPQIKQLQQEGKDLEEYTVLGSRLVMANFEGNMIERGGQMVRERKQPWWDKGYTIDVFYVLYFCLSVMIVVKRLPPYTWQPDHTKHAHAEEESTETAVGGGAKAVG